MKISTFITHWWFKMKIGVVLLLSLLPFFSMGQQNMLPISSFFKDELFRNNRFSGSSFLPRSEGEFDLHAVIRDSSIQYYEFLDVLFKKHLIEIKGDGFNISISPTLNVGLGKDFEDTSSTRLFNNTRGFLVKVDLLKNFSFTTALYENQNRFTKYENAYYASIGERYPGADSTYFAQNGVVPGGARTKPFKVDAFDYAYAIGNIVFKPADFVRVSAGNNSQFVGRGYRSLFLSDNSVPAIYLRGDFKISDKLEYTVLRSKQFNLLRRPIYSTVESNYEAKLFSSQFLNYQVTPQFSLSLFEGSYWNVGDSISTKSVNGAYFLPVPFAGPAIVNNENEVNSLSGLQLEYQWKDKIGFYSQLAISNWNTKSIGSQIGMRYFDAFGLTNSLLQLEYNNVPKRLYLSENSRLNYSSYNLPNAHPKGNGFQEYILRFNYTKKRFYGDWKSVFYQFKNYQEGNLIAVNKDIEKRTGQIYHQQIELGYRVNKKMNLELFVQHLYRNPSGVSQSPTNAVFLGLRTGFLNHYNDF